MVKRVQFLSYELLTLVADTEDVSEKLRILNHYFFTTHRFRCIQDPTRAEHPADAFRLDRVLGSRSGAPVLLELIYAFLAERIGLILDFVDLKPTCFLRLNENGHSRYIDITRGGTLLTSDELIETLHTRFQMRSFSHGTVLEACTFENFISDYVSFLKLSYDIGHEPEIHLFLQDVLISYQPSNLQLVGERALLHRRLGNFKNALADLKRYFAFHDKSKAPAELTKLYDELVLLLEKHKMNIEVLD